MSFHLIPRPIKSAGRESSRVRRTWVIIGMSLAEFILVPAATASGVLPRGGQYVSGQGSIGASGNNLVVEQPGSTRGVIDWRSFSIGKDNIVTFNNGSGATLNRVTGGSPTAIFGRLNATGSVYVINPQGIVVGPSGVVSTGGRFVASTLDVCNCAFMNGDALTLSGESDASVVNLGKISSSGADVFLVARHAIINDGSISAPKGTAEFAAAKQVLLQDSSSNRQVFVQTGSGGTVLNRGSINAAQVSLQAADGNVFAFAGRHEAIRATGTATRDGHVWLVADRGHVKAGGIIQASEAGGAGGTVDMNANTLSFAARGTTVKAGQWNISTPSFNVDGAAARALSRGLNAGTSVSLQTTGATGNGGDLSVAADIGWTGGASLTLGAYHTLTILHGAQISNHGSGNLTLRADAAGLDNGGSVVNQGVVDWRNSTGIVSALYDTNGSYSAGTLLGNSAWTAAPYSGLLTQITAYKLVNSVADLENISQDLAGNYALGKDLNASGYSLTPVGNHATPFTGQFDGMWHVLSNASVQVVDFTKDWSSGIFGAVGTTGVVRDVGVVNGNVTTSFAGSGILVGVNQGLITHAYTTGNASEAQQDGTTFGGLVGRNEGLIERSWSSANVSGDDANGGLVGYNLGTITESYATGSVTPTFSTGFGGGLVGDNGGTISQSFATGPVAQRLMPTGGVVGFSTGTIAPDVYWNKGTTGQTASGGSLPASNGLTTAQMSNPASFAGWDFGPTGAWQMPAGATHPILRQQSGQ